MSKVIPPPHTDTDNEYREIEYYACSDIAEFPAGVHIVDHHGHEFLTINTHDEMGDHVKVVELASGDIVIRDRISAPYIAKSNLFV